MFLRDYGHSLLSRLGKQSRDTFAMLANLSGNEQYEEDLVEWHDNFVTSAEGLIDHAYSSEEWTVEADSAQNNSSLLRRLQNDVLMLDEQATQQATAVQVSQAVNEQIELSFEQEVQWFDDEALENKRFDKQRYWEMSAQDNSLSIHSCHNLQRQLSYVL